MISSVCIFNLADSCLMSCWKGHHQFRFVFYLEMSNSVKFISFLLDNPFRCFFNLSWLISYLHSSGTAELFVKSLYHQIWYPQQRSVPNTLRVSGDLLGWGVCRLPQALSSWWVIKHWHVPLIMRCLIRVFSWSVNDRGLLISKPVCLPSALRGWMFMASPAELMI